MYVICLILQISQSDPAKNNTKPIVVSSVLQSGVADDFLKAMFRTEQIVNGINSLIAPELYNAGQSTLQKLAGLPEPIPSHVHTWPSVASGIAVVINRSTKIHKDYNGINSCYDLLMTAGEYTDCHLDVEDLNMKVEYLPGGIVAICGKVLGHAVNNWSGGNRICIAHYFRRNVFYRMKTKMPGYVEFSSFTKLMDSVYAK